MKVSIPTTRVAEFKAIIQTGKYREDERGHKWANHLVLRSIFKNPSKFATRLSKLSGRFRPDLDDLGLNQEDQAEWHEAVAGKSCRQLIDYPVNAISERYGFEMALLVSIQIPVLWLERGKGVHA